MFDGEETTAIVILITDGYEIFAIPAIRTGDLTYEAHRLSLCKKMLPNSTVTQALLILGANL